MKRLLEPVSEEGRQVVVKLLVQKLQVFLKIVAELLDILSEFGEVFLNLCDYSCEFDIPKPAHHKVGYCVVLVAYEDRELVVESVHRHQLLLYVVLFFFLVATLEHLAFSYLYFFV